ncbi:MAG: Stp1/IreP family PP2C-type Ser/Thr phosphatase [Bacilli bacterium]|nr:Stp1/IreP family PP2C-type Ser/Thr phosphatase [Bacilli bacterium]
MRTFYLTDSGKVRDHNEDSVTIVNNEEGDYLMAIADGMGGHSAGEVASSIAIGYLGRHFKETFVQMTKLDAVNWIRDAVNEINTLIFKHESEHPESKGMGTTLVLAILTKDFLLFGNVGDSSGFVMKDHNLHKVTYDHTLVNLLVSAGELTKEEASVHPKKNVLMKALGAATEVDVDIFDCDMDISEILLSSDGLTGMLDREGIEKVLLSEGSVEEKVQKLVKKANNRGGTDNISVAYLVRDEEGDEE